MLPGIYSAANAMEGAERQQEITARNLAHAQIPGYRRVIPFAVAEDAATQKVASSGDSLDLSPGPYQRTGDPLDLAIQGDGYFAVSGPNGPLFTRNGAFQLNADGQLVTTDGLPVLSEQGGPIELPPAANLNSLRILGDGRLLLGREEIGQLKLVSVANPQKFQLMGATLMALPNNEPTLPATGQVIQGMREGANVHPVQELVTMISVMRQYEAAQRSLKSLSEAIERRTNLAGGQ